MNMTVQPGIAFGTTTNCCGKLISGTKIDVEFLPICTFKPSIKDCMNSTLTEDKVVGTTWSQDVRQTDSPAPVSTLKTPRFPEHSEFTAGLSPDRQNNNALPHDQRESNVFDASLRALNRHRVDSAPVLKLVEFSIKMPDAKRVQLAADFTDWDKAPLDMVRFDGGMWSTTVPLPVGIYAYHFLVDGKCFNDPHAVRSGPDSSGNGYIQIK